MKHSQPSQKEKGDQVKDNPALSKVIERNIRMIHRLQAVELSKRQCL